MEVPNPEVVRRKDHRYVVGVSLNPRGGTSTNSHGGKAVVCCGLHPWFCDLFEPSLRAGPRRSGNFRVN